MTMCRTSTITGSRSDHNRPNKKSLLHRRRDFFMKKDRGRNCRGHGASKPVSRVLSFKTAIYLDAPLPIRSSRLPGTVGPTMCPSTALLRIEFTAMDAFTRHWVSSYLAFPPLPRRRKLRIPCFAASDKRRSLRCSSSPHTTRFRWARAGAPMRGEAVYLCCTFPGVAPGGCYPLSLPYGARTFLTDGPFAPPTRLSSLLA